jgi:hypothetical protein
LASCERGGGKYLVYGRSAPFAGCRKNADLGRLVTCAAVPPRRAGSPATKGALRNAEEGNVVGPRPKMRGQPVRGRRNALAQGDASFARSGGPYTSIVAQRSGGKPSGGHAVSAASRSGKPTQVGGTGTGAEEKRTECGSTRVAVPRKGTRAVREKRKTVAAVVPSRSRESGSKCSHVVAVAEVVRRRLASNTLVRSAPKRVAVRVNGGLARGHRRR